MPKNRSFVLLETNGFFFRQSIDNAPPFMLQYTKRFEE